MKFKLIATFTDLEKANSYITEINEAFKTLQTSVTDGQNAVDTLTETLRKANIEIVELTELKDGHISEIASLNETIKSLNEVIADSDPQLIESLKADLEESNSMIVELGKQLTAQSAITEPGKRLVTIGGENHYLLGESVLVPGHGHITAEELANNHGLLEKLLARKSSVIIPVDTEEN